MIRLFYNLIVLYLSLQLIGYIFRKKRPWEQAGAAIVLALFLLRLFLVK